MTLPPDTMLPEQFSFPSEGSGPRRLMAAVLTDAVNCIFGRTYAHVEGGGGGRKEKLRREALAWVESDARDSLFAYARVCEVLAINHHWLRRALLTKTDDALHRRITVGDPRPGQLRSMRERRNEPMQRKPKRLTAAAAAALREASA